MFARKNCARIAAAARVAGWTPESEYMPRQYLIVARRAQRAGVPLADREPEPIVNPRICSCGCGRPARFASATCARIVRGRERPQKKESSE